MAEPAVEYRCIQGKLLGLGYQVGEGTIRQIWPPQGIVLAPGLASPMWRQFLADQASGILALMSCSCWRSTHPTVLSDRQARRSIGSGGSRVTALIT